MESLKSSNCEACRADSPVATQVQIDAWMPEIPQWAVWLQGGIPQLQREFRFGNFREALAFTNRVGALAEEQGHHPDLLTRWGAVTVTWWTHKIGGLHRNDFVCAARCDQLYAERVGA